MSRYSPKLIALTGSVIIHIIILGLLSGLGLFSIATPSDKVIEVELYEVEGAKAEEQEVAPPEQTEQQVVEEDAIVEDKKQEAEPKAAKPVAKATGKGKGNKGTGTGAVTTARPGSGVPAEPPRLVAMERPYPDEARKAGHEGTVVVKVIVSNSGSVESAEVASSSGHSTLDQAAVEAAYSWEFAPAKDKYGAAVRCAVRIPVSYELE